MDGEQWTEMVTLVERRVRLDVERERVSDALNSLRGQVVEGEPAPGSIAATEPADRALPPAKPKDRSKGKPPATRGRTGARERADAVLAALEASDEPLNAVLLVEETGARWDRRQIATTLGHMMEAGLVERASRGYFRAKKDARRG